MGVFTQGGGPGCRGRGTTKSPRRLRRHLSFANVLACLALFMALGGVGYAATTINGNAIKKQTIGAGKLKKGTLTSTQVKANALTGSVIDESTLTIVPAAQTANFAQTAQTATTASTAASATTAETAKKAEAAETAVTAETATTATTAEDAETVEGLTAGDLQVSCPADTTFYGGDCWDDEVRPIKTWIGASIECGNAGGRLPSLSELIAYVFQDGIQAAGPHWSGDVVELDSGKEEVLSRSETTTASHDSSVPTLGFRCVFYETNS